MKNSINNKVTALKKDAENQDEFMKKLAQIDEKGQLTDDMLEQINGGVSAGPIGVIGIIKDILLGLTAPENPFPFPGGGGF